MNHMAKVTLAAAFVAALVSPVLAQTKTYRDGYRAAYSASHPTRAQHLFEGRNAASFGNFGTFNGMPSGRDALVQSLGN
jgi:hypothetical protein